MYQINTGDALSLYNVTLKLENKTKQNKTEELEIISLGFTKRCPPKQAILPLPSLEVEG